MFPVTVIDNFFPDPDKVVEMELPTKSFTRQMRVNGLGERTKELSLT